MSDTIRTAAAEMSEHWQRARDAKKRADQLRDDAEKAQRAADDETQEANRIKASILRLVRAGDDASVEVIGTAKMLSPGEQIPHWLVSVHGCVIAEVVPGDGLVPELGSWEHPDDAAQAARDDAEKVRGLWLESIRDGMDIQRPQDAP